MICVGNKNTFVNNQQQRCFFNLYRYRLGMSYLIICDDNMTNGMERPWVEDII